MLEIEFELSRRFFMTSGTRSLPSAPDGKPRERLGGDDDKEDVGADWATRRLKDAEYFSIKNFDSALRPAEGAEVDVDAVDREEERTGGM